MIASSPIASGITAQNMALMKPQTAVTPEAADAFAASVAAPAPNDSGDQPPSSEATDDSTHTQAELWESFHKEVNNQVFQHSNRILSYYEQKMKEIDYGNK